MKKLKVNNKASTYRIRETYARIDVHEPKTLRDILPNSSILDIVEIWDGGNNEAHLFVQKNKGIFILYEVIFFYNNSERKNKYEYIIKNTNNIHDITNEISDFCKTRYADTMKFDFNKLSDNPIVLTFFGL